MQTQAFVVSEAYMLSHRRKISCKWVIYLLNLLIKRCLKSSVACVSKGVQIPLFSSVHAILVFSSAAVSSHSDDQCKKKTFKFLSKKCDENRKGGLQPGVYRVLAAHPLHDIIPESPMIYLTLRVPDLFTTPSDDHWPALKNKKTKKSNLVGLVHRCNNLQRVNHE